MQNVPESQFKIRPYESNDFLMLSSWWTAHDEPGPLETMLPEESTWVLELGGCPLLSVSLILTNISEYCYVENFIGNPELRGPERRKATGLLLEYIEDFARRRGYRRLVCLAHRQPLVERYKELGFHETVSNLTGFAKIL